MLVRHNHHVPGGVRENIENDKIARTAKDDKIRCVILLARHEAEDATGFLLLLLDVLIAPRGPEAVHKRLKNFRYELRVGSPEEFPDEVGTAAGRLAPASP